MRDAALHRIRRTCRTNRYNGSMPADGTDTPLSKADIDTCVRVLRLIEADRSHLIQLPQALRRELLTLAGLVAKPERADLVRMAKAFRRAGRAAAKASDKQVLVQAGLRRQRRAAVYTPLWLEPPAAAPAESFLKDYKPAAW